MALYASNGDEFIFAADATPGQFYSCLECSAPVKARRGRSRVPHFYHLQKSSRCRLYSKSEDHLILQLQLQKILDDGTISMERPFLHIHRIADLLWEKENIAFEIQCSPLDASEARNRIVDYEKVGYRVVWLLDDRIFNRRTVRPAEEFLRTQNCYYFSFHREGPSFFYDQMEILIGKKRLKKGFPFKVDLSKPCVKPFLEWPAAFPLQVKNRVHQGELYFRGDLMYRAIQVMLYPSIPCNFEKWRKWEIELSRLHSPSNRIAEFFRQYFLCPYEKLLDRLIDWVNSE